MRTIILFSVISGLSACTSFERSPYSGYTSDYGFSQSTAQKYQVEKWQHERIQAQEDLGIATERPLTPAEQQRVYQRLQLKRLERQLGSSRSKEQYYRVKPHLQSDAERIQYLSIPSDSARSRWAATRGISSQEKAYSDAVEELIENRDIVVGMTKKAVSQSWGDPDLVEVAGNPLYGNERWQYKTYVSSSEGYKKELRVIYFEAGRVAGWEKYE